MAKKKRPISHNQIVAEMLPGEELRKRLEQYEQPMAAPFQPIQMPNIYQYYVNNNALEMARFMKIDIKEEKVKFEHTLDDYKDIDIEFKPFDPELPYSYNNLTINQQWLLEVYKKDKAVFLGELINFVSKKDGRAAPAGYLGNIVKIIDGAVPVFLIDIAEESHLYQAQAYEIEIANMPVDFRKAQEIKEVEIKEKTKLEEEYSALIKHKKVSTVYINDEDKLIIITKPTKQFSTIEDKETKVDLGRWAFSIDLNRTCYEITTINLDYAQFLDGLGASEEKIVFHTYTCWAFDNNKVNELIINKELGLLTDYLIAVRCVYPHDDDNDNPSWNPHVQYGEKRMDWFYDRRLITKDDKEAIRIIRQVLGTPKKRIIGRLPKLIKDKDFFPFKAGDVVKISSNCPTESHRNKKATIKSFSNVNFKARVNIGGDYFDPLMSLEYIERVIDK